MNAACGDPSAENSYPQENQHSHLTLCHVQIYWEWIQWVDTLFRFFWLYIDSLILLLKLIEFYIFFLEKKKEEFQ